MKTDLSESALGLLIEESHKIAAKMKANGSTNTEIADFLEIKETEVEKILRLTPIRDIIRVHLREQMLLLAPEAVIALQYALEQKKNLPTKLQAALKILQDSGIIYKDDRSLKVQTNVHIGDKIIDANITREQIQTIRKALTEYKSRIKSGHPTGKQTA